MTIVIATGAPRPVLHQESDVVRVGVDLACAVVRVVHVDVRAGLAIANGEYAVCGDIACKGACTFNAQPIAIHRAVEVAVAPLEGRPA